MLNIEQIRNDFPILNEKVYDKPLVYLDNAATTQKPKCVVDKMSEYYLHYNSNVHRGVHFLSNVCTDGNEQAREAVREFINASSTEEIIFTRGTTESINLVAYSLGEAIVQEGDEIIITEMEHHANLVPWQMLCKRKKAILKIIPMTHSGELDMETAALLFSDKVKIVAAAHVSNVLGTLNPIEKVIEMARSVNAFVVVDGAQSIQHIPIDVQKLDCDFFAFSGHKLYGPTGIGVLYGKKDILDKMTPWQYGGAMIKEVTLENTTFNSLPFKFEAGTPDYIGIIGLGEAIKYIKSIGIDEIASYESDLLMYFTKQIREIEELTIYGEAFEKSSVLSFNVAGIHHFDLGTLLDRMGFAVRTGKLCAEPVMQHFNISGMVRASVSFYNTKEEIDSFCAGLKKVIQIFKQ